MSKESAAAFCNTVAAGAGLKDVTALCLPRGGLAGRLKAAVVDRRSHTTMSMKNVVICADGTGNSFGTNVSNVTRLVKALILNRVEKQVVFYDQGVGTRRKSVKAARRFKDGCDRDGLVILDEPTMAWWPGRSVARVAGLGFG